MVMEVPDDPAIADLDEILAILREKVDSEHTIEGTQKNKCNVGLEKMQAKCM